ncbi:MAG: PucR family transcriptional regulator, partial [Jatrophihabitans sp.]
MSRRRGRGHHSAWKSEAVRPALREETIRRIEQAAGRLARQSVARMDDRLPWFRELPADQRSWVMLVAQSGLQSYVDWLRTPDDVLRLTGEVFATAPQAMARSVTLQQTVELIRETIAVAEQHLPLLADPPDAAAVREELLRFSREIAFAAARVYARAAESRGAWDERLEALVMDSLVRGGDVGEPLSSQLAALGWHSGGPLAVLAGTAPELAGPAVIAEVHRLAQRVGLEAMAGVHGPRLVLLVGGWAQVGTVVDALLPVFGPGPVVLGPVAADTDGAVASMRATLNGLRAAPSWPGAPRPVAAEALLPERALAGDAEAVGTLVEGVYRPLADQGVLLETLTAFLDAGGSLEATARALFVHANTVRYRLRRVT